MAETSPTPEEHALRRRARRRLVGAIALALLAVVVLPMVFDSEPRPMGNNVNVVIPSHNTPFESTPATPAPAPTSPDTSAPKAQVASPPPAAAETASHETKPRPAKKTKRIAHEAARKKTASAGKTKPNKNVQAVKTPAKPAYYLQLGSFANEANAKKMVAKARSVGFKSSIYHVNRRFKVRVGPIADKAKAVDYQKQLKAKGFSVLFEP